MEQLLFVGLIGAVLMLAVTVFNEPKRPGEFLATEANGRRARDNVTILSGQNLGVGRVCGKLTAGAAAGVKASGTGNGVVGAVTLGALAQVGVYVLRCIAASANAGTFAVFAPDGERLPDLTVAVAYVSDHINLTVADGAADWVVGDVINVTVAAGSGKWAALDPATFDGRHNAAGILYGAVDATSADAPGVMIVRSAEVNSNELDWGSLTTNQQNAAIVQLAALGIVVRTAV